MHYGINCSSPNSGTVGMCHDTEETMACSFLGLPFPSRIIDVIYHVPQDIECNALKFYGILIFAVKMMNQVSIQRGVVKQQFLSV